jgi:hypothetical protein
MDKQTLKQKAWRELKEFLIISLYLWLVFSLFLIYKSVILAEEHISLVYHGLALINALALGKIMLIAKALRMGKRFEDAPLIYPTVLKSALFTVVLAVFKVIEEAAIGYFHGESFAQSLAGFAGGTAKGILLFSLIMWITLIPFVGFGELQRVLGEGRLAQIFFGTRPEPGSQPSPIANIE